MVSTLFQVFADEHVKEIGLVKEVPSGKYGPIKMVGPAVQYSLTQPKVQTPPPGVGEHTDYVLKDILNYGRDTIEKLREKKIV